MESESESAARYQSLTSNGNIDLTHSETFEKVALKMRKMSNIDQRKASYGDRRVLYADTYRFLRPRPETNVQGDEELEEGRAEQMQVFTAHDKFVEDLIDMRYANNDIES